MGVRWVLFVLIFLPALAVPSINFSATGIATLNTSITGANSTILLEIPDEVNVTWDKIEFNPAFKVNGVPYPYRKRLTITEPANVGRSNEKLVGVSVSIPSGRMRSDCRDFQLADSAGTLLGYQRTGCSSTTITFNSVVPSIGAAGSLTWYIYYGNLDDSTDKSTTVGGGFTTTHTNQNIGGCNSADDHCSLAHIGSSNCNGPSSYSPGYAIYVTRQSCSSSRSCGSGCSGSCGISNWEGDLGSTVNGGASGTTSCSTAIMGGFSHSFYLDWSRLLTASADPEELPTLTGISIVQNNSTIYTNQSLNQAFNATLADLSPGSHSITITSNEDRLFLVRSYVYLNQSGSEELSRGLDFSNNVTVYTGRIVVNIKNSELTFTTIPSAQNTKSSAGHSFNSGSGLWTFSNTGPGEVTFNFTIPLLISTLAVKAPKLEFRPSGIPQSENARACFGSTCYLEYNYTQMRDIIILGVANQNDRLLIETSIDSPADCFIGSSSNSSSGGVCSLYLDAPSSTGLSTITVDLFNSSNWQAGQANFTYNIRSLNISVNAPGSGTSGQAFQFSGWANDSVSGAGVNSTVLAVLGSGSTTVDLVGGFFSGSVIVPSTGTHILKLVVLDPPDDDQIFGTSSLIFTACAGNGNSCTSGSDCCSGICCGNVCSSSCYSPPPAPQNYGGSGGGANFGGGSAVKQQETNKTSSNPELDESLNEFLDKLSIASSFGPNDWLDQLSSEVQSAVLRKNKEKILEAIAQLDNYISEKSKKEKPASPPAEINFAGLPETDISLPPVEIDTPAEPPIVSSSPPKGDFQIPLIPILIILCLLTISTSALHHINYWS